MSQTISLIVSLFTIMFFLSCSLGTAYYNDGIVKDVDSAIEMDYSAFVSKYVVAREHGTPWDEQFTQDIRNATYSLSATIRAIGTKYGYEHPSNIYPWLAVAVLPIMFGAYFLFIVQYIIAMLWIGWDRLRGR